MAAAAMMASACLWRAIRNEAQRAAMADPVFGTTLTAAVLAHDDFASALADLIGRRLGGHEADRARFAAFAHDAFHAEPALIETASLDLQAVASDPAVAGLLPPLLHFKGYAALQAWRVSNWLWRHDHSDAALLFQNEASNILQVSIHPAARIGSSVYLDHADGIVIGANVVIGDGVTILQHVSIGRGVFIGAGASILGDIVIGDFAKVGAGTVVTGDVPAGCTVVGNPARLTNCPEPALA